MSRNYAMDVSVTEFDQTKVDDIEDAANQEWDFDDWYSYPKKNPTELTAHGESTLAGGEDEEHFARRLAAAIMEANGGPCKVEVRATYLEDLPYDSFTFSKDDYSHLVGKKEKLT